MNYKKIEEFIKYISNNNVHTFYNNFVYFIIVTTISSTVERKDKDTTDL